MSTEIRSNNKINEMINTKEIPPRNGNPLEVFKVADAVNADEAVSKNQLTNSNFGFKNYIINGGFDVWQRGTSFSENGRVNNYNADRWRSEGYPQTTTNITKTTLGYNNAISYNIVTSASNGKNSLVQRIENVIGLSGKTVTYSGKIKGDGNFNISIEIDGVAETFAVTTSEQKFSITTTLGNTTAQSYITTRFVFASGTTGTIIVSQVQLEEGSVATPFEQRPYGLELSLCQRYYQRVLSSVRSYASGSSQYFNSSTTYMTEMRDTPTVTNLTNTSNNTSGNYIFGVTKTGFRHEIVSNGAGDCYSLDQLIELDAEL